MNETHKLSDVDRHIVLACKGHYKHISEDTIVVLRKIYRKYFLTGSSVEVSDFVMLQRMYHLIWQYGLIRDEHHFAEFVLDSTLGKWYFPPKNKDDQVLTMMITAIGLIQNWQVCNRSDGNNVDLGEADFEELEELEESS